VDCANAFMPGEHDPADPVADIGERIAGCFSQRLTRRKVVTIAREPEGRQVGEQPVTCSVSAGFGDIDCELRQDFPELRRAQAIFRVKRADPALFREFL
jgi:hypothetical protein